MLVAAVAHLTGDLVADRPLPRPRAVRPRPRAGRRSPPSDAEAIRAWAVRHGSPACPIAASGVDPTLPSCTGIIEFCAGEAVDAEYVAAGRGGRPTSTAPTAGASCGRERPTTRRSAASTWASSAPGLGGLCAAIRLEQAGIPYTVFDKNADVGGTWFENTYPDLRVDVPNHFYSYSFRPNPDWSHYYARQHELRRLHRRAARRSTASCRTCGSAPRCVAADVRRGARRVARRASATATASREVEVDALDQRGRDARTGPSVPDIEGLDSFAGPSFHSSRWDHDVDLQGKRVAVVGTGASAMQFVPAIAPDVEHAHDLPAVAALDHAQSRLPPAGDRRGEVAVPPRAATTLAWYRFLQFWNSADRMYPAFRVDPDWATPTCRSAGRTTSCAAS